MKLLIPWLIFCSLQGPTWAAIPTLTESQKAELFQRAQEWWQGPVKFQEDLSRGEVVAWAEARDQSDSQQTLSTKVIGLHPRSCAWGLAKISRYEHYSQHMSFVRESRYDEKTQTLSLLLEHLVLPYPMTLTLKLPRISGPSVTPFLFPHGIFAGLTGTIHVASIGNRCAYFLRASWRGTSTKLSPLVIETFAQTLSKIGLEHLIRISTL